MKYQTLIKKYSRWFGIGLLVLLAGCNSQSAPSTKPDPKTGLVTLHKSTFNHLTSDSNQVAVLFADNKKVLVADNIWENKQFFLVDLNTNTVQKIALPRQDLSLNSMIYAGDEVIAWFHPAKDVQQDLVYKFNANGEVRELQIVKLAGKVITGMIDIDSFLAEKNPQNLINVQEEICKQNATNGYDVTQLSIVEEFYNDEIIIKTNDDNVKNPLRSRTSKTVTDSCERRTLETTASGYEIVVQRGTSNQSYQSDLIQKITAVEINRNGTSVKTFEFKDARGDYYFYIVPIGNRVYFIGDSVKYFDLP